ncbi:MAG: DUF58 domain-containing protein [Kiritimatiellia bacterium]
MIWLAVLLPFAGLAGTGKGAAGLAVALFAALFFIALCDAVVSRREVKRVSIEGEDIARFARNRPGNLTLTILRGAGDEDGNRSRPSSLRLGIPFPDTILPDTDELTVDLPPSDARFRVQWPCTATARGSYTIKKCFFETPSPMGLWFARNSCPCKTEIRVYPDLMKERRKLAGVFLNRGTAGAHVQRTIGQGREFEKLREYIPGDSYEDIHWKGTAKRGRPVTKLYQIERTQEIYVLIDHSRLSAKAAGAETRLEKFLTASLLLGLVARRQGDHFGLVTFTDKVSRFIRAASGKGHHNTCREALYTLKPEPVTPDFDELCSYVRLKLRRRALLMVLTDLSDPLLAESFLGNAEALSRQHVVVVFMAQEPGIAPLFSGRPAGNLNDVYRRLGGHIVWHNLRELEKKLQRKGIGMTRTEDERLSTELIGRYLQVKARQVL